MDSFKPNESFLLTAEQERQWANAIGGVFLNFGFLEFTSLRWVQYFSKDEILNDVSIDLNFAKRIILIKQLIKRGVWTDSLKYESQLLWGEASKLSETRNTIAHNPMVQGVNPEGQAVQGIVNVKQMKGTGPFAIDLIDFQTIASVAIRAGELTKKLQEFLTQNS